MKKYPYLLWVVVLLVGWLFDFLFWDQSIGINFAIYLTLCLLGGLILLLANDLKPACKSLWLLLPIVFFAVITFIRQEPLTLILAYLFTAIALGLLTVTYLGGGWTHYSLFDYFEKFLLLAGSIIIRPIGAFNQSRGEIGRIGEKVKGWPIKPVLRGVLIALPIVIFFAALLSAADLVFNQKIIDFFVLFNLRRLPEYILRLAIVLLVAYGLTGAYLHAALRSKDETLRGEGEPMIKRFLGFTEAAIVLGSVAVLFFLFVIVQFRYFFGGEVNIGVEGFTYSEYARSGFNELISVAFFSLVMILGLSTVTRRENDRQKKTYSGLSAAIAALVIVILVSAYQRLSLAIDWHGFSRLRLYPRVFLIWVGILFIAVIVLEITRRERYFALAAVLATVGFAASLSVVNVDASIVRHNVYRTIEGKHFNPNYLTSLSADAVPGLVKGFMDPSLPVATHEGVGAAIVCYIHSYDYENYSIPDWRSFNYSNWAADNALKQVQVHLQNYRFNNQIWPYLVETPRHVFYQCANEE